MELPGYMAASILFHDFLHLFPTDSLHIYGSGVRLRNMELPMKRLHHYLCSFSDSFAFLLPLGFDCLDNLFMDMYAPGRWVYIPRSWIRNRGMSSLRSQMEFGSLTASSTSNRQAKNMLPQRESRWFSIRCVGMSSMDQEAISLVELHDMLEHTRSETSSPILWMATTTNRNPRKGKRPFFFF